MRPTPFKYTLAIARYKPAGWLAWRSGRWSAAEREGGDPKLYHAVLGGDFRRVVLGERLRRGQYFAILIAAFGYFWCCSRGNSISLQ